MTLLLALGALALGTGLGVLHFRLLRRGTDALIRDGAAGRAIALTVLRFAVLGGVLVGLALLGAVPLLAGAAGIALGRHIELRAARVAP